MARRNLKAWPNGMGFDYRDWELVQTESGWSAAHKPAWFGGTAKTGTGQTWHEAMANAEYTDEYMAFMARQRIAA